MTPLLLALLALDAGAFSPSYSTYSLEPAIQLDDTSTRELRTVARQLALYYGARLTVDSTMGEKIRLSDAPPAALVGLIRVLDSPGLRDAEVDVLVHDHQLRYPVTVTWVSSGTVRLRWGAPFSVSTTTLDTTALDVVQKWPIVMLTDGSAPWSSRTLSLVDEAFSLLSADELERVRGLAFHREHHAPPGLRLASHGPGLDPARIAALYASNRVDGHVVVYDLALASSWTTFVGDVRAPRSADLFDLVHELGHALADVQRRTLAQLLVERARIVAAPDPADDQTGSADRLEVVDAKLHAMGFDPQSGQRYVENPFSESVVVTKFAAVLGGLDRAPTDYGRTAIDEAFADSFALYKLDPSALERTAPDVLAWFEAGGHLASLPHF
jgi:hypothetical protein